MTIGGNLAGMLRLGTFALAVQVAMPAQAEPFILKDCDGVRGIGVIGYSVIGGPAVKTTNELSEVCWNESTATLTSTIRSHGLERVSGQGGVAQYQRLSGGAVAPLNERLDIGAWEVRPESALRYFRWTTESSRTRDELNGHDMATAEGFLVGPAGFTPKPDTAVYDVEMQITGVSGSMMAMVYNMVHFMQGTVTIDGESVSIGLTSFMPGMLAGEMALEANLIETDVGFDGDARLRMTSDMVAGAPGELWKTVELRLEEIFPMYSGDEIAIVGSFVGEMESFAGDRAPVTYSFIASGKKR